MRSARPSLSHLRISIIVSAIGAMILSGAIALSQNSNEQGTNSNPAKPDPIEAVRRALAKSGDGSKLRIRSKNNLRASKVTTHGTAAKPTQTNPDDAQEVPAHSQLAVTIDNQCVLARSGQASAANGLAERLLRQARQPAESAPGMQIYAVETTADASLNNLNTEANADPCVLQIADNEYRKFLTTPPEKFASSPESVSKPTTFTASSVTNDGAFASLTHLFFMHAPQGWNTFFSRGRGINRVVTIGVVDSGIDYTHNDLAANIAHTGGGAVEGTNTIDVVGSTPMDNYGHGSHVAGLIGAVSNNGIGVAGVMGAKVRLLPVKVLDSTGGGTDASVGDGIRWAADHGAQVINLSMEVPGVSEPVRTAMVYAASLGAVIVTAAGNSGLTLTSSVKVAPGSYSIDIAGAVAVASVDTKNGALSGFSNRSPAYVRLAAPGSEDSATGKGLYSTLPGNLYGRKQGTSMAAPLVTGAAALTIALTKSQNLNFTNVQILGLMLAAARHNPALSPYVSDGNVVDIDRLAAYLRNRYMIDGDAGTEPLQ